MKEEEKIQYDKHDKHRISQISHNAIYLLFTTVMSHDDIYDYYKQTYF